MPYIIMRTKNKNNNIWNIGVPDENSTNFISSQLNISHFLAKLVVSKGFTDIESAKNYIDCRAEKLFDPFLMPDMEKAVERIEKAVSDKEKIMIYGDYDVDGVTSVALLLLYLKDRGITAQYYIPERVNEGYGLNNIAIDKFKNDGIIISPMPWFVNSFINNYS